MRLRRHLHYQRPGEEGGQSTPFPIPTGSNGDSDSDSVIDQEWGGLESTSRPDLALAEKAFKERQSQDQGPETGPPEVESSPAGDEPTTDDETEQAAASHEEEPTEAGGEEEAEGEAPAEAEGEEPTAPLSASEKEKRAIQRILGQFRSPEAIAKSLYNIRTLQNRTAEERNELAGKLDKLLADYDVGPDGDLVLKADAAAKRLGQERGQSQEMPRIPEEKAIRAAMEAEMVKSLSEDMDVEDAQTLIQGRLKPHVDRLVKNEIEAYRSTWEKAQMMRLGRIAAYADNYFEKNPGDREFRDAMSKWYERFPEELRTDPKLFEAYLPMEAVAKIERTQAKIEKALVQAYQEGLKDGREAVDEPAGPIAPTGGRGGHGRGRTTGDPDAAFKSSILNAGQMPQLESLD